MLQVQNVSFSYDEQPVLKNISFTAHQGAHISIIGASGCGKSTLLKSIYGLFDVEGTIFWKDHQILGPSYNLLPDKLYMKYLAQDFDLMPYTTVAENVGKYLSNFYLDTKKERTFELLDLVEMTDFADIKVRFLSGGQQQRVALARAIAKSPEIILLDEPFSHIDNFKKNSLRRNLFNFFKANNITCIVATHDSTDAFSFADEVIVLKSHEIIAQANPKVLYEQPKTKYVASLFGEVSEIPVKYISDKNIDNAVLIYPHEITVTENSTTKVAVISSYFEGNHYLIEARLQELPIFFNYTEALSKGTLIGITVAQELIERRLG
ncbi:ABC transporter ATP-binding protein [Zhouia sp. PK063]|uniref:ABC transporter ATP-binding protein n=1 Tax=Zhouia sp. PK063 TaxID=3373602 RepID=UPI0037B6D373